MAKSKVLREQTCAVCGKKFMTDTMAIRYCSEECRKNQLPSRLRRSTEEFLDPKYIKDIDYVECPICHGRAIQLRMDHYRRHGYKTLEELHKDYPDIKMTCQKYIENNLVGDHNPFHSSKTTKEQRQKNSPFSIEFYLKKYNCSEEEANKKLKNFLLNLDFKNRKPRVMEKRYWLEQGYSYEEATQKVSEICVNNGLEYYIKKYGEEEGKIKYSERMKKWNKSCKDSMPSNMRSNASDKFISQLLEGEQYDEDNIMFGNHEQLIEDRVSHMSFLVDFCRKDTMKIIEFNGDYWHCNPKKYGPEYYNASKNLLAKDIWEKDKSRKEHLERLGYDVMIVWEYDWRNNQEETINKAKKFIFQ